jgi:SAM-dependent methyltransferase
MLSLESPPHPVLTRLAETYLAGLLNEQPDLTGLPRLRFPLVPDPPLGPAIGDDLRTQHWSALLETLPAPTQASLLDFGCGAASTQARATELGYAWRGLDIPGSQEALGRSDRTGVTYYDGGRIPFPDNSFDVVLSVQVFEHVVDPHQTIAEIARIVKPGGHLLGSTSHIEPFHSASTFTYTPAVFARLLEQNRLRAQLISPGIDGLTIVARRLLRQFGAVEESQLLNQFFAGHSPLHGLIDACGEAQGVDQRQINALKLELTGQFHFLAGKV